MKPFSLFSNKAHAQQSKTLATLDAYWTLTSEQLIAALHTTNNGIQQTDAESRIKQYGLTRLKHNDKPRHLGCCCASLKAHSF